MLNRIAKEIAMRRSCSYQSVTLVTICDVTYIAPNEITSSVSQYA